MEKYRKYIWFLSVLFYILMILLIQRYSIAKILDVKSLLVVLLGIVILSLSQYRKQDNLKHVLVKIAWNSFYSGLMATIINFLALISTASNQSSSISKYMQALIPVLYGSLIYVLFDWIISNCNETRSEEMIVQNPFEVKRVNEILSNKKFSEREVHVALKIIEGQTNKEIASSLFISEATVKKHIQNMFKKCGAKDKSDFISIYLLWFEESQSD